MWILMYVSIFVIHRGFFQFFSSLFSCSPFVGFSFRKILNYSILTLRRRAGKMDHDWNRKSNRPFQNHITFPMKAAHPLRDISFLTFSTSSLLFYHFQKKSQRLCSIKIDTIKLTLDLILSFFVSDYCYITRNKTE